MQRLLPLVAFLTIPLAAQTPAVSGQDVLSDFLVPVHGGDDDPTGGRYGVWAAGPTWKASFHDGFCFYPFLGSDAPEHRPLRWRTESVRVGSTALPLETPVLRRQTWRVELDHGGVLEAYDVRREGVEQTFTIAARPAAAGDLVVTGRIETPLTTEPVTAGHRALSFADPGRGEVVRYGAAWALDATGDKVPAATAFDGERIEITVDGDFLRRAVFPVTIDPLVQTAYLTPGVLAMVTVANAAATSASNRILTAYVVFFASLDTDIYAVTADPDNTNIATVFADVQSAWRSPDVSACHVANPDVFAIGFQRDFSPTDKQVRVHLVSSSATSIGGVTLGVVNPAGTMHVRPRIGGSLFGSRALLVFERRSGSSSSVYGVRVDAVTTSLRPPVSLVPGGVPLFERFSAPDVVPSTFSSTPWVVTFLGWNTLGNAWRLRAGQIDYDVTTQRMTLLKSFPAAETVEDPMVAGMGGRYLITYERHLSASAPYTGHLEALRLDWSASGTPVTVAERTVHVETTSSTNRPVRNEDLAFDFQTASHWVTTWSSGPVGVMQDHRAARLGHTGGITESLLLSSTAWPPATIERTAACFARPNAQGVFQLAQIGGRRTILGTVRAVVIGHQLAYPTDAISSTYGTSCAFPGLSTTTNRSYAGHEFYRVALHGLPSATAAFYVLGLAPAAVDLTPNGMPGCFLNVAPPSILGTLLAIADNTGRAEVVYALPDAPLFIGDIFAQWFYVDPSAAPTPFRATTGLKHQVR